MSLPWSPFRQSFGASAVRSPLDMSRPFPLCRPFDLDQLISFATLPRCLSACRLALCQVVVFHEFAKFWLTFKGFLVRHHLSAPCVNTGGTDRIVFFSDSFENLEAHFDGTFINTC